MAMPRGQAEQPAGTSAARLRAWRRRGKGLGLAGGAAGQSARVEQARLGWASAELGWE